MTSLTSLIERVEAATEGSRELDRLIARFAGWHRVEPRHMRNKHGGWIAPGDWIGKRSDGSPILDSLHGTDIHRDVPEFTTSLDAVMSLMPEGMDWRIERNRDIRMGYGAAVYEPGTPAQYPGIAMYGGATAPLALLAAILRARQTEARG